MRDRAHCPQVFSGCHAAIAGRSLLFVSEEASMTTRRRALALAAALLPAGGVLAVVLLAACSGAATALCGSQSAAVSGGAYTIMNNEWNSDAPQCITAGGDASFTVTSSSIAVRNGTPGGYPFIYKGCHWGACTSGSGLPIRVSDIHPGTVITSWHTTQPRGSSVYDVTYDIWFNQAPTTTGQPDGAELMIWLNHHGHVHPAGAQVASNVSIGGHDYNVWLRRERWNTISYAMTTGATSVSHLDLQALVADAVSRGYVGRSLYLIAVEAGFELWRGGVGLAANSFSVHVAGGGSS
jgi:Glycosyl hydrolase family 12